MFFPSFLQKNPFFLSLLFLIVPLTGVQITDAQIPASSNIPLPSEAPAPWGVNPDTLSGVVVDSVIEGIGFLQQRVTLESGDVFFHQTIATAEISLESYVISGNVLSNDPEGNLIFKQVMNLPSAGLSSTTLMNGFRQPIQMHFDLVESKVAPLTDGLNQIDIHFRQIPFVDSGTGKVFVRQDIGVWTTSFSGLMPVDVGQVNFTVRESDLVHETALSIPADSPFSAIHPEGTIDFWGDMEMIKIIDPVKGQITVFTRCGDFGDPTSRLEGASGRFQNSSGTRGGCSGGTGSIALTRPEIPDHEALGFQLTPIVWERWNNQQPFSSGLNTTFPRP